MMGELLGFYVKSNNMHSILESKMLGDLLGPENVQKWTECCISH